MHRIAFAFGLIPVFAAAASACWIDIEPSVYATDCPIIVRGVIVAVKQAAPGQERADDLAEIQIREIVKNELSDVSLKVGGVLTVRMISSKNLQRQSTDLNYPVKTEATWLVTLTRKDELRIDRHPVQKQKIDFAVDPKILRQVIVLGSEGNERKTRSAWVKRLIDDARQEAEERKKQDAESREFHAMVAELAAVDRIDATSMRRFQASTADHRRTVFQLNPSEQPLRGERLVDIVEYVLAHDPDDNIRTWAAMHLAGTGASGPRVEKLFARALGDRSADVRLFLCQSLGSGKDRAFATLIRPLLNDEKRTVRLTAVRSLGLLGDTESLPTILKLYDQEVADEERAWTFAMCLAALGDTKVSLAAVRESMKSDNWNIRYFALRALDNVDAKAAIPLAMECFAMELQRIIQGDQMTGFNERNYLQVAATLMKRTGKNLGDDPARWIGWWEKARSEYNAPTLAVDGDAARKAYAAFRSQRKP